MTLNIAGADTGGTTALSFKALGLLRPVEFQARATAVSANTITCTGASWTTDKYNGANGAYYVELVGPAGTPGLGTMYDIIATNATTQTITLAQNLASGVANNAAFRIRKQWTLASVFGPTNDKGLQGGFASTADSVLIYSGGAYKTYYYSTGGFAGTGWRLDTDDVTDRANTVLYPEDGILIRRRQPGAVALVLGGEVKTGSTSFPIVPGLNIVGNPYAVAMTLASSGLYTGDGATGLNAGFATSADQVLLYTGAGYQTYYYSSGGFAGVGWRRVDDDMTDQSGTPIPAGTSFIVRRVSGNAFNWLSPQHPGNF